MHPYLDRETGYISKEYIHHGTPTGDVIDYQPGDDLDDEHFTDNDLMLLLETDSITLRSGRRRPPAVKTPEEIEKTPEGDGTSGE